MESIAERTRIVMAARTRCASGRPSPSGEPDQDDCGCPWELVDDAGVVIVSHGSVGIHAVQALMSALLMIGDRVAAEFSDFTWCDGEIPGTGFPHHRIVDGRATDIEWDPLMTLVRDHRDHPPVS